MKNIVKIVVIALALACSGNVSAQKKPIKKPEPLKVKKPQIPPPPPRTQVEPPPPSVVSGYPTIAISSEQQKYEDGKICTTCDTLVLEPGKPHIVMYDVKWMSDHHTQTYREQPTASDLKHDYYALKNLNKREWDELRVNFPEKEVEYHHVYRNTFIKIKNTAQEHVNLLNRQDRHEGFIYWSGKPADKIFKEKKMALLTENVAKLRGSTKVSSYYAAFKKDSLAIEELMKTTKVDENMKADFNAFLLSEILDEYVLPVQFMTLKNVKTITINPDKEKKLIFSFNKSGQLTAFKDRDEKIDVVYKDNLPVALLKNDKPHKTIAFQGNVVSVRDNYNIKSYEYIGKTFFKKSRMYVSKENYDNFNLLDDMIYKIVKNQGETCEYMKRTDNGDEYTTCYSNNQWELPLTITEGYSSDSEKVRTISMNGDNELMVADSNLHKSTKMTYQLENQIIKSIQYSIKRGSAEAEQSQVIAVNYEYLK